MIVSWKVDNACGCRCGTAEGALLKGLRVTAEYRVHEAVLRSFGWHCGVWVEGIRIEVLPEEWVGQVAAFEQHCDDCQVVVLCVVHHVPWLHIISD